MVVVPSGQAGAVKAVEAGGRGIAFACAGDSVDLSISGIDTQVRWLGAGSRASSTSSTAHCGMGTGCVPGMWYESARESSGASMMCRFAAATHSL